MEGEFPSNSQRRKREEKPPASKKVERVIEGEVVRRKKPLGRRLKETFFGGADATSVWGYVFEDVLLPAARDTVADAVSQGVERMIFGEARSHSRRTGRRPGENYTNYPRFSGRRDDPRDRDRDRSISRRGRASFDFDEIILDKRVEAEEVIDSMFMLLEKYDLVTVADLYDLVGIAGNYTDEKWGWTDLRGAGVSRITGGYLLDLPRPEPIN
jgi:outer membrane protein OmpA-like peptidoglycan-associated protein